MTTVSTHVLDTTAGIPASGVGVQLEAAGRRLHGTTDADGRVSFELDDLGDRARLTFDTTAYFEGRGSSSFYPSVVIDFVPPTGGRCHVPLLLSPYGYTTYRGS